MNRVAAIGRKLPGQRDDWFFVGGSILVILVLSVALYIDFNLGGGSGSGEIVGKISFKHKTAQRKFDNQVIWDELETETTLYNKDTIRTAELSEAVITLKDGTKIQLDESSMIILNITDKSANIDFAYGSVQAKREGGAEGEQAAALNIRTQDNKVISIQNSDVKLSRQEGEELSLTVQRGQASVAVNGRSQTVEKDQRAVLAEEIQVKRVVLIPLTPGDGERGFINENQKAFQFTWQKPDQPVTFELASDRGFGTIVSRQVTPGAGTVLNLGDGTYFWRLSVRDQRGQMEFSEMRRFTVIRNAPASLLSPAPGTTFDFTTEPPLVNFAWTKSEYAQNYRLEVAADPGFQNMVDQTTTTSTSISRRLKAGAYFFRVSTISEQAGTVPSAASSFTVVKKEKTSPPTPLRPTGDRIGRMLLEKEGLAFSWAGSRDIQSARIEVSPSANFSNIVYSGSSETNFITVKQALNEGQYFWRVRGTDRAGNATDYSAVASFNVAGVEKVTLRMPPDGTDLDPAAARDQGVQFLWEGPDYAQFRMMLSQNPGMAPVISSETLTARGRSVKDLAPGKYFWKVALMSQSGNVLSESETRSFTILDMLGVPNLLEPPRGQTVDMTDKNDLYFRWDAVRGADGYDFTLYRDLPEGRRPILNLKTQRPEFLLRDLSILDVGAFSWSVSAYGKNQISQLSVSNFAITLRMDQGQPQITTPGVQYTE
jgi:hypothetical protein